MRGMSAFAKQEERSRKAARSFVLPCEHQDGKASRPRKGAKQEQAVDVSSRSHFWPVILCGDLDFVSDDLLPQIFDL